MRRAFWWAAWALAVLAGCGDPDAGNTRFLAGTAGPAGDPAARVFDETQVNDFRLTIAPADWDSIIWDTMGDAYRHADLAWNEVVVRDVGVRPSGNSTRYPGNQKMSLKFKFDAFVPDQKFLGLGTLKLDGLRERTMMRSRLSFDVCRARLPATPRAAHCRLLVNSEYRGVYLARERVTGHLVHNRFGPATGNLYRILVGRPEAFAWQGADPSLYVPSVWVPKTNETGGHGDVPWALDTLNNDPEDLDTAFNLDTLTEFLALEAAVIAYDGMLRDAGPPHNFFTYHRVETGKFELIPWDLDQTWTALQTSRDIYFNFDNTRIAAVVRDTPSLNALYRQKIGEIIGTETLPSVMAQRIDFIYDQIRDHVYADPYKVATNSEFDSYPALLKSIAQQRYDSLLSQLSSP